MRDEALDHVLVWPSRFRGKTTMAFVIANEWGVNLKQTSGPVIEKLVTRSDFEWLGAREQAFYRLVIHRFAHVSGRRGTHKVLREDFFTSTSWLVRGKVVKQRPSELPPLPWLLRDDTSWDAFKSTSCTFWDHWSHGILYPWWLDRDCRADGKIFWDGNHSWSSAELALRVPDFLVSPIVFSRVRDFCADYGRWLDWCRCDYG